MKDRIKEIRTVLDLTQQEFADRLGIKRGGVANYELGRNKPIDAVISLICREFNVNEEWLRNGTGEMFKEESTFSLDEYAATNHLTDTEIKILRLYMELDESTRRNLLNIFKKVFAPEESTPYDDAPKDPRELERLYPPINDIDADSNTG